MTDNGVPNLADSETITVTVNELNVAPVLDAIGNQTVNELALLSFTATASDADDPANTLSFSLASGTGGAVPAGASIDSGTGLFSWTPTEAQGPGTYIFDVVVTDNGVPNLADSETITVTVNELNVAPVLDAIGNQTVNELALLSFTATASDADDPANTLSFSLASGTSGAVPAGASIDPGTGVFSWTPTEAQGPGTFTFDVVVTDNGVPNLADSETITVTVNELNVAPVLDLIGNQTVDEFVQLTFTATASDSDLPATNLTYSLDATSLAEGMTINASTGQFNWTPTEAQGPGTYSVSVTVTDEGTPNLTDVETFQISVNEITNDPPVLDAIGNQTVDEQALLSFTATASDDPADTLSFSLVSGTSGAVPTGASIDPNTGVFSWTPTEAQGPGTFTFDVVVTDNGVPNLADSETITVTVNELNVAPVLGAIGNRTVNELALLSFTATASDVDDPANTLSFSLASGTSGAVPTGASIDPTTGVFSWTPTEAQGPGTFTFDVVVTDNGVPNLADSETITVTVNELNVAPVLGGIGNQTVNELALLSFTATASDVDDPANTLSFSLASGTSGAVPAGASIDPATGVFSWTPTEAQGPGTFTFDVVVTDNGVPNLADSETITVTVDELNVAPVLGAIGNQTVNELALLSFTATASDADDPANTLSFSLASGTSGAVPAGASIDPVTGVFSWTPTEAQGPGTFTFDVVVTDNGVPNLADSETITVTVNELNVAPVLGAIGNQTVNELELLSFTATASDADDPANALSFSLASGTSGAVPTGASIDPGTGVFSWTPTEAQGPGTFTFDVVVTDNGVPNLADSETITVTVNELNVAPVLDAIGNQTVNELALLSFTATASDADDPANTLSFSLASGTSGAVPGGASIDPARACSAGPLPKPRARGHTFSTWW